MKHYDQNTIELYVPGSQKVEHLKEDLERHLGECFTCKGIAQELTDFYRAVGNERPLLPAINEKQDDALIINPEFRPNVRPKLTVPERLWAGARAHPISSSLASVGVLSLALFMLKTNVEVSDTNPQSVMLNETLGGLVVYNKSDEILWQIPQPATLSLIGNEGHAQVKYSLPADLDGDGVNEVLTTLPLPTDTGRSLYLRVFDSKKTILVKREFSVGDLSYRGQPYTSRFEPEFPLVLSYHDRTKKDILVAATNRHSPMFVARLDPDGLILGRVWHYGSLGQQYLVDLDGDGDKEMILCGINDVDEKSSGPRTVIMVLDPRKIIDDKESTATRGFGFEPTDCELYYILLPQTDVTKAMNSSLTIYTMEPGSEKTLRFSVNGVKPGDEEQFEFIFSKNLKILEVKPGTWNKNLHERLKNEGRISSVSDESYILDLKHRIKYWNGQRWVSEHTRVDHSQSAVVPR